MNKVQLGKVSIPSGTLLILDPGLAMEWCHDQPPTSRYARQQFDFQIVGPDAIAAGIEFDRNFHPEFFYDRPDPERTQEQFAEFQSQHSFDVSLKQLDASVPHVVRAQKSTEYGNGLGIVQYNGMWGVAISGLPEDKELDVSGIEITDEEFQGRFQSVEIVIDASASKARSATVEGVMVDHGQLICADLQSFGEFQAFQPVDGLADYVYWGKDAKAVQSRFGGEELGDDLYGWKDIPMDQVQGIAQPLQKAVENDEVKVGVDFRPHCNLTRLNAELTNSQNESMAVVSNMVQLDDLPIHFADRLESSFDGDSGWIFTSGNEDQQFMDNPDNLQLVRVKSIMEACPELKPIIFSPAGSRYHRDGDEFVAG